MSQLVLILGDQLSFSLSSLDGVDKTRDTILLCEVMVEATYVGHHKKKIAFLFSAMRHFAEELRGKGYQVRYTRIDDRDNAGSFSGEVQRALNDLTPSRICVTEAGEWRVKSEIERFASAFNIEVDIRADRRFLASHEEFERWAAGRKSLTMEYFYREMRRKTGLLMNGEEPVGGRWNFDSENRSPAKPDLLRPRHPVFAPDRITSDVIDTVERLFPDNFGKLENFGFAVTRADAERALSAFINDFLMNFGATQDAMLQDDPYLNHSLLSFYINCGCWMRWRSAGRRSAPTTRARHRSMPWRVSFARSSAGGNICVASTGLPGPTMSTAISSKTTGRCRAFTGRAKPT